MFLAQAASLRSSNPSRQVGAVIATDDGDVVAVGANEVPKLGGGLHWIDKGSGLPDWRKGYDSNDRMKKVLLKDVLERLKQEGGWLNGSKSTRKTDDLVEEAIPFMTEARLMDILEFGRAVHAEMAALMDAARRTISVRDLTLYGTTLPCHECAKHIIAAGISRVVYIEPYPKSRAEEMFEEAIVVDPTEDQKKTGKVRFEPFVGVAPRQYIRLFTFSKGDRKSPGGLELRKPYSRSDNLLPRYRQRIEAVGAMELKYAPKLQELQRKLKDQSSNLEVALKKEMEAVTQRFEGY
jgi:cytidine deaminase